MKTENKTKNIHFAVIATDVACFRIVDKELCLLIGRASKSSPFPGEWALIGGMININETAEDSVSRLLDDKAGIKNIYTEQVYTFSDINRDPRGRVVSVAYMALTNIDPQDISKARLETKWCPVSKLPKLAYDHDKIVKETISKLRFNIQNTDISRYLIEHEFTFSELQSVYEIVLGDRLDKRNFRKKIIQAGRLKDIKKTKKKGVMRPAKLYVFK